MIKYVFIIFISLFCGINLNSNNFIIFILLDAFIVFVLIRKRAYKGLILFVSINLLCFLLSFIRIDFLNGFISNTGIVIETKENYYIALINFERVYIYEKGNLKEVGDIIHFEGNISSLNFETLESAFDFNSYLFNKGIRKQLYVTNNNYVYSSFLKFKLIKNNFLTSFDDNAKNLIEAILFNYRDNDSELIFNFNNLSLFILISTSGIYLNIIKNLFYKLFNLFFDDKKSKFLSLLSMSYHLIFVINKLATRKFIYLEIFKIIDKKRKINHINKLSILGILFLLTDYHLAISSSFYLTFGISIFSYYINNNLPKINKFKIKLLFPFLIYLIMLPFIISSNNELSLLSLFIQFAISPFTSIFCIFSYISFHIIPFTYLLNPLGDFIYYLINLFQYIDINIYFSDISNIFIVLYCVILFFSFYFMETRLYKISNAFFALSFSIIFVAGIPYKSMYENSVTFINVGQGDCCVIRNKNKVIMIDSGGKTNYDIASNSLIKYFKRNQIYQIDYFFGSHNDYDHIGALSKLQELIPINKIIISQFSEEINIGDISLRNINTFTFQNDNDNSSVIKFNFINKTFLFTGDIGSVVENKMIENNIDVDCDVLKVSHHGSSTSSTIEFLKRCSPIDAVISVGKNSYGHPNKEILDRLNNLNINIRRTDIEGSISYR